MLSDAHSKVDGQHLASAHADLHPDAIGTSSAVATMHQQQHSPRSPLDQILETGSPSSPSACQQAASPAARDSCSSHKDDALDSCCAATVATEQSSPGHRVTAPAAGSSCVAEVSSAQPSPLETPLAAVSCRQSSTNGPQQEPLHEQDRSSITPAQARLLQGGKLSLKGFTESHFAGVMPFLLMRGMSGNMSNPDTSGLFEECSAQALRMLHACGGMRGLNRMLRKPGQDADRALMTLLCLASGSDSRKDKAMGALPSLDRLLSCRRCSPITQQFAAMTLDNLASDSEQRAEAIAASGVLRFLVASVSARLSGIQDFSLAALVSVAGACSPACSQAIMAAGAVPAAVSCLSSAVNASTQEAAAQLLQRLAAKLSSHTDAKSLCVSAIGPLISSLSSSNPNVQEPAAVALGSIAVFSEACAAQVMAAGGVQPLLSRCLSSSSWKVQRGGAGALGSLALHREHAQVIAALGAVKPLTALLGEVKLQCAALYALRNLSAHVADQVVEIAAGPLVACLTASEDLHYDAVIAIANLAEFGSAGHIGHLLDVGAVEGLVRILSSSCEETAVAAAMALGIFLYAQGMGERCADMIGDAGAIPVLVNACLSVDASDAESAELWRTQACELLGSLATASDKWAAEVAAAGGLVAQLIAWLSPGSCSVQQQVHAAWALAQLSRGRTGRSELISPSSVAALVSCLSGTSDELRSTAAEALGCLAEGSYSGARAVVEAGAVAPLLACLSRSNAAVVREEAVVALRHLTSASVKCQRTVTSTPGALGLLASLLCSDRPGAKSSAAGILGDLADSRRDPADGQTEAVIAAGALGPLVACLSTNSGIRGPREVEVQEVVAHAAWALGALARSRWVAAAVAAAGAIRPLVAHLVYGDHKGEMSESVHVLQALKALAARSRECAAVIAATIAEHRSAKARKSSSSEEEQEWNEKLCVNGELMDRLRVLGEAAADLAPAAQAATVLVQQLHDPSAPAAVREQAALALWVLAGGGHKALVAASGALPQLVGCLVSCSSCSSARLGELAAGAICSLSAGSPGRKAGIVAVSGAIPALVMCLAPGNSAAAREQAAGALKNLASAGLQGQKRADAIVAAGAVPALLIACQSGSSGVAVGVRQQAAGALRRLAAQCSGSTFGHWYCPEFVGAVAALSACLSGAALAPQVDASVPAAGGA